METKQYLTHVNALRGLAILLVFLYHLCPSICPKGYYGVDIFFVLSGYFLIQGTWKKIQKNTFTPRSYILGKISRIYPSLITVISITLLVTYFLFSGSEFSKVIETGKSALLGYSNLYIDSISSNYFLTALDEQPLLHTWYLSITLQAYIFFPLVLMVLSALTPSKHTRWAFPLILIVLAIASLGVFYWDYIQYGAHKLWGTYWNTSNPHPYYWSTGRVWEFAAGGLIPYLPNLKTRWLKEMLVSFSLVTIIVLSYYTALPALCGIVIVAATMLIVRYTDGTAIARKSLSLAPLLWLGTISFSLYLWHLPIISFVSYIGLTITTHIPLWVHALTGILCLLLSIGAYHLIEHREKISFHTKWTYVTIFLVIVSLGFSWPYTFSQHRTEDDNSSYASWVYETDDNLIQNFPDSMRGMRGFYGQYPVVEGYQPSAEKGKFIPAAHIGVRGVAPNFVLIGDSHANHLFPGLDLFAQEEGYSGIYISRYVTPFTDLDFCTRHFEFNPEDQRILMSWLQAHPELETIIIGQRWHARFGETRDTTGNWHFQEEQPVLSGAALARFCKELNRMGKQVIVIGPIPECPHSQPSKYIRRCNQMGFPIDDRRIVTPKETFEQQSGRIVRIMQEHEKQGLYKAIYPHVELFSGDIFNARLGNTAIFSDAHHLNLEGSKRVIDIMKPYLRQWLRKPQGTQDTLHLAK